MNNRVEMETDSLKFESSGLRKRNSGHDKSLLALIGINVIVYLVMIFFNVAAGQDIGVFKNKTGDISDANEVNITPAGATFSTWGVIYTWQTLWIIFNVILIFKKNENGRLYREPPVLTLVFHFCILFNFVFNAAWLALWDSQLFTWSLVFTTFMTLSVYAAIFISTKNTKNAEPYLKKKRWALWLYRLFVNNGLTFYATWLTVATLINLAIAITYNWAPSDKIDEYKNTSSVISLSILAVILFTYFACDVYFFEKFLRYTWSQYLQLIVALTGILAKHWNVDDNQTAAVYSLVLIIIVGLMFIIKIGVTFFKTFKER